MGIHIVLRGEGDMKKSDYDPDEDGVIAIAQTEADMKKSVYDGDDDGYIDKPTEKVWTYEPSDDLIKEDTSEEYNNSTTWTKIKEITVSKGKDVHEPFSLRVTFTLKNTHGNDNDAHGRIYVNDVAKGDEHIANQYDTYMTFTDDITGLNDGDKIQLYIYSVNGYNTYTNLLRISGKVGIKTPDLSMSGSITG